LLVSTLFHPALAADTTDYVDNNSSDVDTHADHGTHSSFAAEQSAPDSSYDTLTEAATSSPSITTAFTDGFEDGTEGKWDGNGASSWVTDTTTSFNPQAGTYKERAYNGAEGVLTSDNIDLSGVSAASLSFYYYLYTGTDLADLTLLLFDGTVYDSIAQIGGGTENVWTQYTIASLNSQYFISNFRIQLNANLGSGEIVGIDTVLVEKTTGSYNYELDLEVQWTAADFDETNELLRIYAGTQDAEALKVDVWTGSWTNIIADLAASTYTEIDVSSYLTSATFTLRFLGGTESSDTSSSSWQIDSVYLHTWSTAIYERTASLTLDWSGSTSRLLDFYRSGTLTMDWAASTSRARLVSRSVSWILDASNIGEVSRLIIKPRSASLDLDWSGVTSRILMFPRAASLSLDWIGATSRLQVLSRAATLVIDWAGSAIGANFFPRVVSFLIDWSASSSRILKYPRTAALSIDIEFSNSIYQLLGRIISFIMDFGAARTLPAGGATTGDFTDPGDLAEAIVASLILIPMGILLIAVIVRRRR
jgi:hypothetical protein